MLTDGREWLTAKGRSTTPPQSEMLTEGREWLTGKGDPPRHHMTRGTLVKLANGSALALVTDRDGVMYQCIFERQKVKIEICEASE
jgi:hypothetical protein